LDKNERTRREVNDAIASFSTGADRSAREILAASTLAPPDAESLYSKQSCKMNQAETKRTFAVFVLVVAALENPCILGARSESG
jgi:hypothetical protein